MDFSDNGITRFGGFPLLQRLSTVLINNNQIRNISEGLGTSIPNLEYLVLTGNNISNLADLDALSELVNLKFLSLLQNPVRDLEHYRLYMIHKIPSLNILDYQKISHIERREARELFGGEEGKRIKEDIERAGSLSKGKSGTMRTLTPDQELLIRKALERVTTMEETRKLDHILQTGKIPENLLERLGFTEDDDVMVTDE
eukprot:TRINITY_DN1428_c0_g1_i2.p1 TRINITY_DN1428_c0_g1~~TRINITY_DN1428_c0_g1_i2.p1  ORF type:complete len:200 (-),score=51.13 TRINITY_DN1428_c0_g1_i2:26-625(-)